MISGVSINGIARVQGNLVRTGARLYAAQESGVKRGSALLSRMLKEEMTADAVSDPFWGKMGASGDGLAVRSGKTRASIAGGGTAYRIGNRVTAAVGSSEKHLLDHEKGGVFGGKSPRGFHRIPTAAAKTAAGVDRYLGQSIRDIAGSFLVRTLGGRLWAAVSQGRGRLTLLYLLVRTITLKPRRIFARVSAKAAPQVDGALRLEVATTVQQGNR